MLLQLIQSTVGRVVRHSQAQVPLVLRIGVLLEERRCNEWLDNEKAAQVDTIYLVLAKVPRLVERRGVGVGLSVIVERVLGIVYP